MITSTNSGDLKAFSAICTHEGCKVKWNGGDANIQCPCHQGTYHPRSGRVISGPPPYPLRRYEITTRGQEVYVGGPI
jgi:cytochrome b6-f complex iron-sulfur subunit